MLQVKTLEQLQHLLGQLILWKIQELEQQNQRQQQQQNLLMVLLLNLKHQERKNQRWLGHQVQVITVQLQLLRELNQVQQEVEVLAVDQQQLLQKVQVVEQQLLQLEVQEAVVQQLLLQEAQVVELQHLQQDHLVEEVQQLPQQKAQVVEVLLQLKVQEVLVHLYEVEKVDRNK